MNKEKQLNKIREEQIIEKLQKEILSESDSQRRFQLIQQLELFARTIHVLNHVDN